MDVVYEGSRKCRATKKNDIRLGLRLDIGLEVKVDANGCQHAGTHQRRHHRLIYKEIQNKLK